jgi:hypothetical protein
MDSLPSEWVSFLQALRPLFRAEALVSPRRMRFVPHRILRLQATEIVYISITGTISGTKRPGGYAAGRFFSVRRNSS